MTGIKTLRGKKGFTLIEVIIVLVIIAILAAILIPSLTGYIDKASQRRALAECRQAVVAAQTLYSERYGTGEGVSTDEIEDLAEVPGTVSGVGTSDGIVLHLTYTNDSWMVTYCRDWETCSEHDEMYTTRKNSSGSTETGGGNEETTDDDNPTNTNTTLYFYIADDANYKVASVGDLATYDFGPYGALVPTGTVFYWQGDYYYTRWDQYLTNSSDRQAYLNSYGVKINIDAFTTPGSGSQAGDLKLAGGKVYVFFPQSSRYYEDYYSDDCWFEVQVV